LHYLLIISLDSLSLDVVNFGFKFATYVDCFERFRELNFLLRFGRSYKLPYILLSVLTCFNHDVSLEVLIFTYVVFKFLSSRFCSTFQVINAFDVLILNWLSIAHFKLSIVLNVSWLMYIYIYIYIYIYKGKNYVSEMLKLFS